MSCIGLSTDLDYFGKQNHFPLGLQALLQLVNIYRFMFTLFVSFPYLTLLLILSPLDSFLAVNRVGSSAGRSCMFAVMLLGMVEGGGMCDHSLLYAILSMITDNQKSRMIEHFMGQVKAEDMINIAFSKPIEVALRTHKHDQSVPSDALPKGLMIAQKNSINDNKFALKRIRSVEASHLEDLRAKQMDNYISLLKKPEQTGDLDAQRMSRMSNRQPPPASQSNQLRDSFGQADHGLREPKHSGMQIGICVSMSKQPKKTLKNTIKGVANNIDQIVRSGVSPDDIFVVVVIDGVRSVDDSIYEYFQEFERESQIFLEEDESLTLRKKYEHQLYHSEVAKDEPLNYSKFLFKEEEFQERVDSKFINIRKKYDEILRIKASIQNIKKDKAKDNENLKMIVNRMADKQRNILKRINKGKKDASIVISEDSIMKELASSEEECNQYVNTRQDLAYVSAYRLPTTSLSEQCRLKARDLEEKEEMDDQGDGQRLSSEHAERRSLHKSLNRNGKISSKALYVNLFFCIKYKESGKLNSQNWFLNGFCQQLNPKYSFLIDVGVRPYPDAIFKMYRHLKLNPNVGGVCGYLRLIEELVQDEEEVKDDDLDCLSSCLRHIFDIQRSQQIQTHYDHILEKSFEGMFGFIHVLPSFFSGYNMDAIRPPDNKDELLRQYFRSIDQKIVTNKIMPSTFTPGSLLTRIILPRTIWKKIYKVDPDSEEQWLANENTYQAHSRILCLGIHKNNKDITFMPDAFVQVEPIKRINDLMEHRKQEINGGVFSFDKVQSEFRGSNKKREKFLVKFQLFYLSSMKFMTFFAPAILMFLIQFATQIVENEFLKNLFATESTAGIGTVLYKTFANIVIFIFTLCMLSILFFSLHLRAKDKRFTYYAHLASTILGVFVFASFMVFLVHTIVNIVQENQSFLKLEYVYQLGTFLPKDMAIMVANILTYLLYFAFILMFLPAICYAMVFKKFGIFWEVIVGSIAYLFYLPTEYVILQIYARCRLDDVYGESNSTRNIKMRQTWNIVKMIQVSKFLFWNIFLGMSLISLHNILLVKFFLLFVTIIMYLLLFLIKWIPGLIYIISYKCSAKDNPLEPSQEEKEDNILHMQMRIFDTIKHFEDDFTFNIKESFQAAAVNAENKEIEKKLKMEEAHKKAELKAHQKAQRKEEELASLPNPVDVRGVSTAFSNILQMNQPNLTAKVQTIRESSAIRPSYYPFQEGIARKKPQNVPVVTGMPLEMVLLKNQIGNEVGNNAELKEGEEKLKKYETFRTTIKPLGF